MPLCQTLSNAFSTPRSMSLSASFQIFRKCSSARLVIDASHFLLLFLSILLVMSLPGDFFDFSLAEYFFYFFGSRWFEAQRNYLHPFLSRLSVYSTSSTWPSSLSGFHDISKEACFNFIWKDCFVRTMKWIFQRLWSLQFSPWSCFFHIKLLWFLGTALSLFSFMWFHLYLPSEWWVAFGLVGGHLFW